MSCSTKQKSDEINQVNINNQFEIYEIAKQSRSDFLTIHNTPNAAKDAWCERTKQRRYQKINCFIQSVWHVNVNASQKSQA